AQRPARRRRVHRARRRAAGAGLAVPDQQILRRVEGDPDRAGDARPRQGQAPPRRADADAPSGRAPGAGALPGRGARHRRRRPLRPQPLRAPDRAAMTVWRLVAPAVVLWLLMWAAPAVALVDHAGNQIAATSTTGTAAQLA